MRPGFPRTPDDAERDEYGSRSDDDAPTPGGNTAGSASNAPASSDNVPPGDDTPTPYGDTEVPTQDQAQDALNTLDGDRAALAARVVTPPWYHPILGMIAAAMTFGLAIQSHYPAFTGFLVFSILAIFLLERTYAAIYGVSAMPSGRRSKAYYYTRLLVLLFTMATAGMFGLEGKPLSWCIPVVAIQFILLVTLGHRQDDAMRREIAQGE